MDSMIRREFPPETLRRIRQEGIGDEEAARRLGVRVLDYKLVLCYYLCTGDL